MEISEIYLKEIDDFDRFISLSKESVVYAWLSIDD